MKKFGLAVIALTLILISTGCDPENTSVTLPPAMPAPAEFAIMVNDSTPVAPNQIHNITGE